MIRPPFSHFPLWLLSLFVCAGGATGASPQASDEILTAFQTCLETGADVAPLVRSLDDLPSSDLTKISSNVEMVWPKQLERYHAAFAESAREQHRGEAQAEQQRELRTLRAEFHKVRAKGEDEMKALVKSTSWPAVQSLRALLIPSAGGVLKKAPTSLQEQRRRLLVLATFRNGVIDAAVLVVKPFGETELATAEQELVDVYSGLDRDALRVMKSNVDLAAKADLPRQEVLGLRELNEMRALVGLKALAIDPKLCQAARGHSQDMAEHNFFSHTSPLPGKTTPSQRAAKAGTSGGGENIYMGSSSSQAANKGWFFSPGHHKNMFNGGYGRVGLGNHGRHWTQMFGR